MANTIDLTGDLPLVVPVKGATNWDEDMKNKTFQKIADHDHTAGKGSQIDTAALSDNAVTNAKMADNAVDTAEIVDSAVKTAKIADSNDSDQGITAAKLQSNSVTGVKINADAVDQSKIADNAIQIEHKKTIDQTLGSGAATTLTGVTVTNDQAIKLNYRIHNTGTATSVQIGTLTGQAGDYLVDEFVGTDIGAIFSWSGNNLQLTGTLNDKITYSIEFLE